jgi:hypothetical protein
VFIVDEDGDTWQNGNLLLNGSVLAGEGTSTFLNNYLFHAAKNDSGNCYMKFTNDTTGHTQADGFEIGLDSGENVYIWHREAEVMYLGGAITDLYFYTNSAAVMRLTATAITMSIPCTPDDHGTATNPEIVAVVYGTGSPPAANTTPIGTLWIKYTA